MSFYEDERPSCGIDQTSFMELVAHIARGDCAAAAAALDHVFRGDARAEEWIAQARNSNLAAHLARSAG